jgi:methionyl-tRNA formyltransferase
VRIIYAGTPPFAVPALESLRAAGHDVALVLTQPDRPAGRGLKLTPSAVAQAAASAGLRVEKPKTLRAAEAQQLLRDVAADVMVVAAYGLILPAEVLATPRLGCLNIHASLLPRWRGAAPIHRAILAGDAQTGVSIMQMDVGLDTGPVLLEKPLAIDDAATTGALTATLAALGAAAIVEAIEHLPSLEPRQQDETRATYAAKVTREEARIDWSAANDTIARQVRAFDPQPGAEARLAGEVVKIWRAKPVAGQGMPGEVLRSGADGIVIACGSGALDVSILQRAGGRRLPAADFLRGHALEAGARLL